MPPLRHNRIQRATLSAGSLNAIREAHVALAPYLQMTLEEFELGFMRDAQPESEIRLWSQLAAAWQRYLARHCAVPPEQADGAKLVRALLGLSMGITEAAALDIPADTYAQLRACYDGPDSSK